MARILPISKTQRSILSLLFSLALVLVIGSAQDGLVRTIDPKISSLGVEKLSHFHFYWHNIFIGPNKTTLQIIKPVAKPGEVDVFGLLMMFDDPITEGDHISSKLVGRAEGFYGVASTHDGSLIQAMNLHFDQGKYKGSTLTVLGRNAYHNHNREMSVVGGTGLFRFARGYAALTKNSYDPVAQYDIVEYDVYVIHYEKNDGAFNA